MLADWWNEWAKTVSYTHLDVYKRQVYGNLCDVDAIQEVADRHGLKVIYDAAHAFGVEREGVSAAAFGDASMFSFHATKVFNTIEGGCVCFRDPALYDALNHWKNFGIAGPEDVVYVGGNAKMNEFCACLLYTSRCV